jgi:hypothetical protein
MLKTSGLKPASTSVVPPPTPSLPVAAAKPATIPPQKPATIPPQKPATIPPHTPSHAAAPAEKGGLTWRSPMVLGLGVAFLVALGIVTYLVIEALG